MTPDSARMNSQRARSTAVVKEAASANLSTLASTTCFRTADGEFHGFEGSYDQHRQLFRKLPHVWNYETATAFLFPSYARSLCKSAFGYNMEDKGGMHLRQFLPAGKERHGLIATVGQMGQIIHTYLDWKLCGDKAWLQVMWPRVKMAIEYAWTPGGWDADRDGVMEGSKSDTYDVDFMDRIRCAEFITLAPCPRRKRWARAMRDKYSVRSVRDYLRKVRTN